MNIKQKLKGISESQKNLQDEINRLVDDFELKNSCTMLMEINDRRIVLSFAKEYNTF